MYELLSESKILLICVGDLFHSELRGKTRWEEAFKKFQQGDVLSPEMAEEVKENISLLQIVLSLKSSFPEYFHVLKGNHENILNEKALFKFGNVPFKKFCDEGMMFFSFIKKFYDDLILHEISCFEKTLPICAVLKNSVVSHAEPRTPYTKKEIINYHDEASLAVFDFTWTALGKADEFAVEKTRKALLGKKNAAESFWYAGHRPTAENFTLVKEKKLIFFHNPIKENFVLMRQDESFNPDLNIISI